MVPLDPRSNLCQVRIVRNGSKVDAATLGGKRT